MLTDDYLAERRKACEQRRSIWWNTSIDNLARTELRYLDEIARLRAELDATRAKWRDTDERRAELQQVVSRIFCRACRVAWSAEEEAERCDCAHRESWPHEWALKRKDGATSIGASADDHNL